MKISIITVTYNSARTLSRAMRSVCNQTYKDIEYILVDGESSDSTTHIIKDFAANYPFIRYVSERDSGIYDAINKGIKMATGDIIGILNSDDEFYDSTILAQVTSLMEKEKADILYGDLLYCRYDALEHNPPRTIRHWKGKPFENKDLKRGWMPAHPTLYCRREVFEQVGLYRTDFRISADYEFVLRAFSEPGFKKIYLNQIIVRMEIGGISNRNLRSLLLKSKEDRAVMKLHGMNPCITLTFKVLRKVKQFRPLKKDKTVEA